jgi:glycine/D-amino acid oxidase-like deaminating enzyme
MAAAARTIRARCSRKSSASGRRWMNCWAIPPNSPERIVMAVTPRQLEQYQYIAQMNNRLGHRVDVLDPQQVREAVPLAGENCLGGIHYRFGGHANPHRAVQAYAWALQDLGGTIIQHAPATGFRTLGRRCDGR